MNTMNTDFKYTLDAERDDAFLQCGPRDSLWLQVFQPGDQIVCCSSCRKVFYADDWTDCCPLCKNKEHLWFLLGANQLLWRERITSGGATAEVPMRAWRVRHHVQNPQRDEAERLQAEIDRLESVLEERSRQIREERKRKRRLLRKSALIGSSVFAYLILAFALVRLVTLLFG